ncbi:YhcH/YjgK/YiaL family protein [Mycoplasmopsis cricetuli]|uniref:YhcH/YjgK/YiaL family protein n=1 Tax=Mycoplasmopsis cricetuli TaxID=171283 RepID=UPI00046F9989|nr:YhcH/YjgK/YiaL family protein [Mycoplasmopsis cricetuli]
MIIDKLINLKRYEHINGNLKTLINWLEKQDFNNLPSGKIEIDEDKVFGFHINADSYSYENAMYEFHKKYLDFHINLDENESYYFAFPEELSNQISAYNEHEDVALYRLDTQRNFFKLKLDEFAIFFPEEAHCPKFLNKKTKFKKLVFKVKID